MATQVESIQQLYVAYFNRPADAGGLAFWLDTLSKGGTLASISKQFAAQAEYKVTYGGMSADATVNQIYQNLFNRSPDVKGLDFWSKGLQNGTYTIDNIVELVAASAQQDPAKGPDTIAIQSKVAAAVGFTDYLNTNIDARIAYSTGASNQIAKDYIHSVVDAATLAAATANLPTVAGEITNGSNGTSYNLTSGVDTIVGTAGNNTITGSYDAINKLHGLSGLDTIDGGAGIDTLVLNDAAGGEIDFRLATAQNVEILKVTSVADIVGNAATDSLNLKTFAAGLTEASISVKQGADLTVTAATTTKLAVTNDDGITIIGAGGEVSANAGAGAIIIGDASTPAATDANKITSVTTTGGTTVNITDNSGTAAAVGSILTKVSVAEAAGAITLTGNGITDVTLIDTDQVATLVNTKAHALNLTVDGVTAGAEIIDDTATSVNLTVATESVLIVDAGKAATLAVTAAEDLTLTKAGSDYAALTKVTIAGAGVVTADLTGAAELVSIDASGSTGGVDVTIVGTNSAAGGAAAQSVTGGAGDDTVTITGTLGTGSVLNLGAGSDSVKVNGGTITAGAVVDAGAGNDILALSIVGGANVGAFKNFEQFDVAGIATSFDQAVLNKNNTVTNFIGSGAVTAAVTLQNLGAGVGFIVTGDMNVLPANVVTLSQATAGALTISTDVDGAKGDGIIDIDSSFVASNAKTLTVNFGNDNVDVVANKAAVAVASGTATALTIDSNGSNVTNTFSYSDTAATAGKMAAITVTGDQHLNLTFASTNPTGLASVDASGQTAGGVTFDLNDLTAAGTIKLGAGDDVLNASGITTTAVTTSTVQTISGLEKAAEKGLAAQDGFDVIKFAGALQAAGVTAAVGVDHSVVDGLYTFIGAGAPTLALAVSQINLDLAINETVVFEFAGDYYVYGQGAAVGATDDLLVKLTGVTSVHGLDIAAATEVYVF